MNTNTTQIIKEASPKGQSCCGELNTQAPVEEIEKMSDTAIHESVRQHYGSIAKNQSSCCGSTDSLSADSISRKLGYKDEDLLAAPEGANLGLGCGNPLAFHQLKPGDTVLDLGSGAGFDCFLAAQAVGPTGQVIGVDMTPEMIVKANQNKEKAGVTNVEFRHGYIETLPVESNTVDMIISNCVINLSPDKEKVFGEAYRVIKPGGMLMVSDIVLLKELPTAIKNDVEAYAGCIAGASLKNDYLGFIRKAGFEQIEVLEATSAGDLLADEATVETIAETVSVSTDTVKQYSKSIVQSIKVKAVKPLTN